MQGLAALGIGLQHAIDDLAALFDHLLGSGLAAALDAEHHQQRGAHHQGVFQVRIERERAVERVQRVVYPAAAPVEVGQRDEMLRVVGIVLRALDDDLLGLLPLAGARVVARQGDEQLRVVGVLLPRGQQLALGGLLVAIGQVEVHHGEARPALLGVGAGGRDRLSVGGLGLVGLTLLVQEHRQQRVAARHRLHLGETAQRRFGLVIALHADHGLRPEQQRIDVLGVLREHGLDVGEHAVDVALRAPQLGAHEHGSGMVGVARQDLVHLDPGLGELASGQQQAGELLALRDVLGVEADGLLELPEGVAVLTETVEGVAELEAGIRVLGIDLDQVQELDLRLAPLLGLEVGAGAFLVLRTARLL